MREPPMPKASTLESHLGFWLRAVSNRVSSRFHGLLDARGTSVTEWVALRTLFSSDGTSHAELIDALGMTKGATSKVVSRLVEKGLVGRRHAESNARDQILFLTDAGKRLVPDLAALADQNDAHFFGHLPVAKRSALAKTLRDLAGSHGITSPPLS